METRWGEIRSEEIAFPNRNSSSCICTLREAQVPVFTNWNGERLALHEWAHLSNQNSAHRAMMLVTESGVNWQN